MGYTLTSIDATRPTNKMTDILGALRFKPRSPRPLCPFPPLPVELIRHIIELTAEDRSAALRLMLVSKPFHAWIMPLFYRTVTLRTSEQVRAFHDSIHDSIVLQSTSSTAASQVKNLFMRGLSNSSAYSLTQSLSACKGVERLVLDSLHRQPLDSSLSWPSPWEVTFIYGASSWLGTQVHPVLRNVTHLHLDDVLFQTTLDACKHCCPRLTHLGISHHHTHNNAVNCDNFVRLIKWLLTSTPSLDIVLLHSIRAAAEPISHSPDFSDRVWRELAKIEDDRLLARPGLECQEYFVMLGTDSSVWDDARVKFGNWRKLVREN